MAETPNDPEQDTLGSAMRWWEWLLLAAILSTFVLQAALASPRKSAAFDEQYHLSAGYAYWRTGDFRLATNHPPLAGLLAGAPLLTDETIALPLDHPAWETGDRFLFSDIFLWESNSNGPDLMTRARQPIILLGGALLLAIFFWARRFLGVHASWLVLTLAALDPNLVANARLVTTDLPLTCFFLMAIWQLWRWLDRPSWPVVLFAGIAAGLAMASKYTGLMIWPVIVAILFVYPAPADANWRRRAAMLIWMALAALAMLWAIYGFDFGPVDALSVGVPLPAPFYWQDLSNTFGNIVDPVDANLAFLLDETSFDGWWYYFPVALAVKTPLSTLLLGIAGAVLMIWRRLWRQQVVLWTPVLAFILLGLTGVLTIGYRHLLPAIPFMIMLAGNVTNGFATQRTERARGRLVPTLVVLLLIWLVVNAVRFHPHQEAFFNELAGPWSNWSQILVDSNLDWGQDLPALRNIMEGKGIEQVNLAYFGKSVPELYGVRYAPLPSYLRFIEGVELNAYNPYAPEPGWYAVSATSLRLGLMQPESVDLYAYFRDLTPDARAGYSIYLYEVRYRQDLIVDRVSVVGQKVSEIPPDVLGQRPGRRVQVKWLQSPDAVLFPLGEGFFPPTDDGYNSLDADFGGIFSLLGYRSAPTIVSDGQTIEIELYWKVGDIPMPMPAPTKGPPLSAFVHLTREDPGKIKAQFDGWRTALRGLEPSDVIVQRVQLEIDEETDPGSYFLRAGLYSPQTGQRVPVTTSEGQFDQVSLGAIAVE